MVSGGGFQGVLHGVHDGFGEVGELIGGAAIA